MCLNVLLVQLVLAAGTECMISPFSRLITLVAMTILLPLAQLLEAIVASLQHLVVRGSLDGLLTVTTLGLGLEETLSTASDVRTACVMLSTLDHPGALEALALNQCLAMAIIALVELIGVEGLGTSQCAALDNVREGSSEVGNISRIHIRIIIVRFIELLILSFVLTPSLPVIRCARPCDFISTVNPVRDVLGRSGHRGCGCR